MRIVDIREVTKLVASSLRNAHIDFSKMTCAGGFGFYSQCECGRTPGDLRKAGLLLSRCIPQGGYRARPELPGLGSKAEAGLISEIRALAA